MDVCLGVGQQGWLVFMFFFLGGGLKRLKASVRFVEVSEKSSVLATFTTRKFLRNAGWSPSTTRKQANYGSSNEKHINI